MRKNQADRSVIAARLPGNPRPRPVGTPGTNPALRPATTVHPQAAPVRNRRAPRLTGMQRNSIGRRSEWSRSPYAPSGGWR